MRLLSSAIMALCFACGFFQSAVARDIKIGVIYDETGPFADSGSRYGAIGARIAIDMINERGGVEGNRIVPVYVDAQSKVDVAINEVERLVDQDKVDLVYGLYSSAQCVPIASKLDAIQKVLWIAGCGSTEVLHNKHLKYVFRTLAYSDTWGSESCDMVVATAKTKLGLDPKDVRVAVIYEDDSYGTGMAAANVKSCSGSGMQIVMQEGYASSTTDLSLLVTKLKRAHPDVILHTGYAPDVTLFLRQARELGLKTKVLIGHGGGYSAKALYKNFPDETDHIFNVDLAPAQLLNPAVLQPNVGDLSKEVLRRAEVALGTKEPDTLVSNGFNPAWVLFTDVLPRAIKTYGGFDSEAIRKAALDVNLPVGGTVQGFGVKFAPESDPMAGQNLGAFPVVTQYSGGEMKVVWPEQLRAIDPVIPLPPQNTFGRQ